MRPARGHDQALHGAPQSRGARVVALEKPTDQGAVSGTSSATSRHLPTRGEIVLFDRSRYNRAGVERVMGFCNEAEYEEFMRQAPEFEASPGAQRAAPDQALVLGRSREQRRRLQGASASAQAVEAGAPSIAPHWTRWRTTPRPRRRCSSTPTLPTRPGRSSRAMLQKRAHQRDALHPAKSCAYENKSLDLIGRVDPLLVGCAHVVYEHGEKRMGPLT